MAGVRPSTAKMKQSGVQPPAARCALLGGAVSAWCCRGALLGAHGVVHDAWMLAGVSRPPGPLNIPAGAENERHQACASLLCARGPSSMQCLMSSKVKALEPQQHQRKILHQRQRAGQLLVHTSASSVDKKFRDLKLRVDQGYPGSPTELKSQPRTRYQQRCILVPANTCHRKLRPLRSFEVQMLAS